MTLDEFFAGYGESRRISETLDIVIHALGPVEIRATKSQVASRRARALAWAWVPDRYLGSGHAPLLLTASLSERRRSPRWKQIVEPAPRRFTHHPEPHAGPDGDDEVGAVFEHAGWRWHG